MTSSTESTKRLNSREARVAELRAIRARDLEQFETEREIRWLQLLSSAQRLVIAFERYPEFSEGISVDGRGYRNLKVDLEPESIEYSGLGKLIKSSMTYDQAVQLKEILEQLEDQLKNYLAVARLQARQKLALAILRKQGIEKLTDAEKVAFGVYKEKASFGHADKNRKPADLDREEQAILAAEMPNLSLD